MNKRDKNGTVSRQVRIPAEVEDWAIKAQRTFSRSEKPSKHDVYIWLLQQALSRKDVVIGEKDLEIERTATQCTMFVPGDIYPGAYAVMTSAKVKIRGGMEAIFVALMRCAIRAIEQEQTFLAGGGAGVGAATS